MIYEWLAHKMIGRNLRLVRLGLHHRVWLMAFWISFAAYAATDRNWLKLTTFVLLVCAVIARVMARRRALLELEKVIQDDQKRSD